MKTARLITCENLVEAYLIKGKLANEGIECFLTNQYFTNLMPLYNNMLGSGIRIFVLDYDLEKAKELVSDKINPKNEEMKCPHCGSTDIKLGIGKNKGIKIINMILAVLSALPLGNLKPMFYCKSCGEEIK